MTTLATKTKVVQGWTVDANPADPANPTVTVRVSTQSADGIAAPIDAEVLSLSLDAFNASGLSIGAPVTATYQV